MCLAKKYSEQIKEIIHKAKSDMKVFSSEISNLDKELSEKYHEIETTNFNAYEGYCLAKSLQYTLQKRRTVKHEFSQMKSFLMSISNDKIEQKLNTINQKINSREKNYMVYSDNFDVSIGDVLKDKLQLNELN